MDEKLQKKIRILISNSFVETQKAYRFARPEIVPLGGEVTPPMVEDDPTNWELSNNQAILLVKLYQQLSGKEQSVLLEQLGKYLTTGDFKKAIVETVTLSLIHTGNVGYLIETLTTSFTRYTQNSYAHLLQTLNLAIASKPNLFKEEEIERLYDWANEYLNGISALGADAATFGNLYEAYTDKIKSLHAKCNIILTRNFAVQIESAFNPELNQDEQRVIEQIEQIGLPLDLAESLKHISDLVQTANQPMKYRDCMSAIRAFTERLYEKIAKEIDPKTKVDGKDSEEVAKLFKKSGLLSQDMANLLVSIRHFLSNDGTHRLKSRKEDARIAKNMTIELSLYLLTRLRELRDTENTA